MNFKTRELTFGLKDKVEFREEEVKEALKAEGFPDSERLAGPE